MKAPVKPSLRIERGLHREGYQVIAGMDEVGRGALAGPVSVGVVLVNTSTKTAPVGVRDSKLLSPSAREALVQPVRRWALAYAVGHASPQEIDTIGIIAALRLAGTRALEHIADVSGLVPDLVILDGKHDWLTHPLQEGLFALEAPPTTPPVRMIIKGDRWCSSVAAASILAKVERDGMLRDLSTSHPAYHWHVNKGYAAPEHLAALATHGPCVEHRRSWHLPGQAASEFDDHVDDAADPEAAVAYAGGVMGDDEASEL